MLEFAEHILTRQAEGDRNVCVLRDWSHGGEDTGERADHRRGRILLLRKPEERRRPGRR